MSDTINTKSCEIKILGPDYLEEILAFKNRGASQFRIPDNVLRSQFSSQLFLGAIEDGNLVGLLYASDDKILNLEVSEKRRKNGYGSQLLAKALEILETENRERKITLLIFSNNDEAMRLYERFGFHVASTQTMKDLLLMEREPNYPTTCDNSGHGSGPG